MTQLNKYFNNFSEKPTGEQLLVEDLIVESININGHNVQYLPRESYDTQDGIFGESVNSKFNRAYTMPVYIANVEGYEGDGDFFSKFGLEIRDTSNFVVSRRAFQRYVPSTIAARPREGDLLYVPVLNKIFEIKFVEEELLFFSLGKRNPYMYELRCELFRYSQEDFNTGHDEIDDIEFDIAYTTTLNLGTGTGLYIINETVYQGPNLSVATATATVKEFDATNKELFVYNVVGAFNANSSIIGATSNASYNILTTELIEDSSIYDQFDNNEIQSEADDIIILDERNPFGAP